MSSAAVALRDVFCVHRTADGDAAALQGLTLELEIGRRLCVLGPSGSGKTTLLRVIAGLQTPSAGAVLVFGRDPGRESPRRRAQLRHEWLGFLDQHADSALSPDLSVGQAVALPLALRGVAGAARRRRVGALLDAAGLSRRAGARPAELSGGERQRVAVCVALAHRPRLLLADEPTAELDRGSGRAVSDLIDQLADADGATVITVSHDPALAGRAQRAVRLEDGRVVEDRNAAGMALVVDAGGWLRLPEGLRRGARIDGHVRAEPVEAGVLLRSTRRVRPAAGVLLRSTGRERPAAETPPEPVTGSRTPAQVALRGLTRRRGGRFILNDLTLDFPSGALTAVIGPSGTGKTTLLELVAGLDEPDQGEVLLDGRSLSGLSRRQVADRRRERIGYLAQEPVPIGFLSARENVALALRLRGWTEAQSIDRAGSVLDRLGLGGRAGQRARRLSAGEAQRVALARAIACAGGLLIVDEPTSRLDRRLAASVSQTLRDCVQDGQTVICATHDPLLIKAADQLVTIAG